MWCFIFVESVHKQKCKNKHGFSVSFVINVLLFFCAGTIVELFL